jgi:hypothetical protein
MHSPGVLTAGTDAKHQGLILFPLFSHISIKPVVIESGVKEM